jgi:hypothetical protein
VRRRGLGLVVLAAALVGAPPAVAQDPVPTVRVEISDISAVLQPDGRLQIAGRVFAVGSPTVVRDLQLRLYVAPPVNSRSALATRAADPDAGFLGRATTVPVDGDPDLGTGDASVALGVDLPVDDLAGLADDPAVHPLRIEVRGRVGSRSSRRAVATVDTFVQWWPRSTAPTRIAWVWPLVGDSGLGADGVFADERLAEELAPAGRLGELLSVGVAATPTTPVTWAVDPALVAAARRLQRGYRVRADDDTTKGTGGAAAEAWLGAARAALADPASPVLALPYGDVDLVALVRQGREEVVAAAYEQRRATLAAADIPFDPRLAWPPDSALDRPTLDVIEDAGASIVVLADSALPPEDVPSYTPTASVALGTRPGAATAVASDGVLDRILVDPPAEGGERLAVQRFLAETAMITLERPSSSRDVVVTPPRDWAPRREYARDLLRLSAGVPWLEPVTLPAVAARTPDPVSRFLDYPSAARARELPAPYLAELAAQRERAGRFRSILPQDAETTVPETVEEAVLRAASAAWRDDLAGGRSLLAGAQALLDRQFGRVRVSTGGVVIMTSDTGRIPLTVVNDLPHAVLVRVQVDARGRLALDRDDTVPEVIPPGTRQLEIRGRAVQAGEFTVVVRLLTPDGGRLPGSDAVLRVRSTAYGRLAIVLIGGAGGVLVVASVVRLIRRRRA